MDFLKYLDVLIGLALVMVLLTPAVTAITQLIMSMFRLRAIALQKGIRDLIRQLGTDPLAEFAEAEITMGPANTEVSITGFEKSTTTANGIATCRRGSMSPGSAAQLLIATTPPAAGQNIQIRLRHRLAEPSRRLVSPATDASGKTTITYATAGPADFGNSTANVSVLPAGNFSIDWKVTSGPHTGETGTVPRAVGASPVFAYPKFPPPRSWSLELTARDGAGRVLANTQVVFDFNRNDRFDVLLGPVPIGAPGNASLHLPATLAASVSEPQADEIAKQVLRHPMIAKTGFKFLIWPVGPPLTGNVIEREELIRILLELAANEGPAAGTLKNELRTGVQRLVTANGIPSPSTALADIRSKSQEKEKENPAEPAHIRQAKAIIEAAGSEYVGKINNWFDQAMVRVGHRYTMWARVATVFSAFLVAYVVRVDSLDLLRRLSADDKFRESLLNEANAQQKRIEEAAKSGADAARAKAADAAARKAAPPEPLAGAPELVSQNDSEFQRELASARAKRDDIEQSLAKLRDPQLAIVPDHFFWQTVPRARLVRNEAWRVPYPNELELVLGSATYTVVPRWPDEDPLAALEAAITTSGAPVDVRRERNEDDDELVVYGSGKDQLQLAASATARPKTKLDTKKNLLSSENEFAQASIPDAERVLKAAALELVAGDRTLAIGIKRGEKEPAAEALARTINGAKIGVSASRDKDNGVLLVAEGQQMKWIVLRELRDGAILPMSKPTNLVGRRGRVSRRGIKDFVGKDDNPALALNGILLCEKDECKNPDLERFRQTVAEKGITALVRQGDALVLTSHRLGTLQLRHAAGKPDTNILNRHLEQVPPPDGGPIPPRRVWPGVGLSWILLSLGAPFWYDLLKDLLRLRPSLARSEEQQRNDRQTDTTRPPAPQRT